MAGPCQLCECMQNVEIQAAGGQPKAFHWIRLITFLSLWFG
jgi:hypothetical protein